MSQSLTVHCKYYYDCDMLWANSISLLYLSKALVANNLANILPVVHDLQSCLSMAKAKSSHILRNVSSKRYLYEIPV